jgi:hypothetical protein
MQLAPLHLGPADYNFDETMSTLRYANRAKNIKNKPKINEDPKDAMLREFQEEIARLKAALGDGGGGGGGGGGDQSFDDGDDPEPEIETVTKVVEVDPDEVGLYKLNLVDPELESVCVCVRSKLAKKARKKKSAFMKEGKCLV